MGTAIKISKLIFIFNKIAGHAHVLEVVGTFFSHATIHDHDLVYLLKKISNSGRRHFPTQEHLHNVNNVTVFHHCML